MAATVWELRIRVALSHRELGERLGVGAGTVSRWEPGKRRPSEGMVERIEVLVLWLGTKPFLSELNRWQSRSKHVRCEPESTGA